jgi:hypothetical protein
MTMLFPTAILMVLVLAVVASPGNTYLAICKWQLLFLSLWEMIGLQLNKDCAFLAEVQHHAPESCHLNSKMR